MESLEEYAQTCANNHAEFECFVWSEKPDDADKFTIQYTRNRDSRLLEESNHAYILKQFEELPQDPDNPDVWDERHNHWAVGWVECFIIRVYDCDGEITEAFRTWYAIQERLENYPVLDESDYSERENNATWDNVKEVVRQRADHFDLNYDEPDCPTLDDLAGEVMVWLNDKDSSALENRDDQGGYPDDDEIDAALIALEYLEIIPE